MSERRATNLLLVEDSPGDARLLREMLNEDGSRDTKVTHVERMSDAERHLAAHPCDIVLLDLGLPDAQGLGTVQRARAAAARVPLVVLSGFDDEMLAVEALKEGAQDYLVKGQIDTRGLMRALRYAVERKALEERYRSVMEHANDAILLFLPGGRILEANRRAEELLGLPRERIMGQEYATFTAPEDEGWLAAEEATLVADGSTRVQDCRLLRGDGTVVFVDVSASLIRLGDEPIVLAILHDTSERRQSEQELGAARARLHYLVSENPAVIYAQRVGEASSAVSSISENVERLLGYTAAEALAPRWWTDHLHPDERARVAVEAAGVFASGRIVQEYRLRHRDGSYRWFRDEKRLVRDAAGQPSEVVGTFADITARKSAEQRLLDSEEQYRILFDSNPHPMWVFDAQTLAFLAVNDAAVGLYGYSRDEFLAMTIKEIRPLDEAPALVEYLETIPDTPSLPATQVKHRKKDGSLLEVAGSSNAIEFHGRRARLVLAHDVSEQRRLEGELLQAQKMEAVGRLAGGVAHDFNNLLGVITGYSELLLKSMAPQHSDSRRVEQILKAARLAAGLTRQLLAFSRRQVLQPRTLDLGEILANVEKMLVRLIGDDIQITSVPGVGLGHIRADPGQVEQVLMNLVVNARDAMPKGGRVCFETANVVLDEAYSIRHPEVRPGPFVMLSVRDTGVGMDAHTQAHIFEPFFTTKEEGKGTGLGLATVFGIVQQSGGSVIVESQLGVGTKFTIYFPRVEGELARASLAADADTQRGTETVLLVEDAAPLRVMVREILEEAGYVVIESADAEDALSRLPLLDQARLVLTDVVMPRMSGPDLVKRVRTARPDVKVLFMSGYTDAATGLRAMLGVDTQFIQKPFAASALLAKVREILDQASAPADALIHRLLPIDDAPGDAGRGTPAGGVA
jgi:two-component system, cell cycle sensor histidine kinase and response regulator CckA